MAAATVLGFFANKEGARAAADELRRKGLPRCGLVHKTQTGKLQTWDPFPRRRITRMLLAATLAAALTGLASAFVRLSSDSGGGLSREFILGAALLGLLASGLWYRRVRYGVDRRLLTDHARLLVVDETVLVLQAPLEALASTVALLREAGEIPPVVFYLHPTRASRIAGERKGGVSLSLAQIEDHAQ